MINRIGYFVLGSIAGVALSTAVLQGAQRKIDDAVKVSPQFYSVRLENDRVRVLDYRLPAGQNELLHSHQAGVAYVISGAKLRTTTPEGVTAEGTLNAGDVHWRDKDVNHAVQNIGDTDMRALIVELKN